MPGFDNNTVFANNIDLSGNVVVTPQMVADGQLLIGATGGNPNAATLSSIDGSIGITNGPNSINLSNSLGLARFPITSYVVGLAGEAGYTTIQSALDAANAAGIPAAVYVKPGTYTENLTLYDGIDLWGAVGVADTQTCTIIGTHTPPASGTLTIRNIFLQSATNIFNSAVAGTAALILIDCAVNVTNGYTFNLPNWTGSFTGFDIGEIGSTNDGWINNTGGAFVFMVNITMGAGNGNTCIISGNSEFYNVHVQCPITFQSTGTSVISGGCWFDNTLTTANTAVVSIFNSLFDTGANQAITHSSASTMILSTTSIDSSNNPAIGGTGTIDITGVDFIDNAAFAGTLTISGGKSISDTARLLARTANAVAVYGVGGEIGEVGPLTNGQLIIGSTGAAPSAASISNGNNISWTAGAGTLEADLTGTTDHCVQVGNATGSLTSLAAATNGQLIIGSTGADPSVATLTAGVGVSITNAAGSITINSSGAGVTYEEITDAAKNMEIDHAYGANRGGGVTFTLPATAAIGTTLEIVGISGLWVLAQNAGQTVYFGNTNTTAGVGGSLTATNAGDCITLRCIVANTSFRVTCSVGNITVA